MKKRKAQNALETTVAYLGASIILGSAYGFLAWGIAHLPARWATYWATRVMAGTPARYVYENGATPMPMMPLWPTYVVSAAGAY